MSRLFVCVILLFIATQIFSQEGTASKVYRGEAAIANVTPEEARVRAIRKARLAAVEQQCGVNMQAETMVKDFMLSGDYIHSVTYGQVVEEKIIKETVDINQPSIDQPPNLTYVVEMQIATKCETGLPDPSFRIALNIIKKTFVSGEEMILDVTATQDCYVTVVNFAADDKVYVLIPSQLLQDNLLTANTQREFPGAAQRQQGVHFRLGTVPGRQQCSEVIQVIATKRKIDFLDELETEGGYGVMPTLALAGTQLARWLATIPVSERAEAQVVIEVRER